MAGVDYTSLLLAGGAAGASALGNYFGKKNDQKNALAILQAQIAAKRASDNQSTALDESKLDPFRQQMSQAGDLSRLDRLERSTYTPVKFDLGANNPYAKYVPNIMGGYSYEKSPELIQSAASLKRNIMGGNVDPSMTDPNSYGKTGALNLLAIAAAGADPGTVNFRGGGGAVTGGPAGGGPVGAGSVTPGGAAADAAAGAYGYTPPADGDLSQGFGENHATLAGAGRGAVTGAKLGSYMGLTAAGAGVGAAVGAIKARTNDTKNQREDFAQNLGFQNTNELWQHLQQTLPPNVAAELQGRALSRIGKHDVTANAQWEKDVQAALAAAASGGYAQANTGTSFTGRG